MSSAEKVAARLAASREKVKGLVKPQVQPESQNLRGAANAPPEHEHNWPNGRPQQ